MYLICYLGTHGEIIVYDRALSAEAVTDTINEVRNRCADRPHFVPRAEELFVLAPFVFPEKR